MFEYFKSIFTVGSLSFLCFTLTGCGIIASTINHRQEEARLLKPGALDMPIKEVYDTYNYYFLDQFRISHQFPTASRGCSYAGLRTQNPATVYKTGEIYKVRGIFEKDGHTYQRSYQTHDYERKNPSNIDMYTRPEWTADGRTWKGFEPICFESWGGTSHVLAIKLFKKNIATWKNELAQVNPNGQFSQEIIGSNEWLVQKNELLPRRVNSTGGAYLHYTTAIGDSGYTLTIQLGANQDSLKYPQSHAQMQAIFRHLLESVKIEPIKP